MELQDDFIQSLMHHRIKIIRRQGCTHMVQRFVIGENRAEDRLLGFKIMRRFTGQCRSFSFLGRMFKNGGHKYIQ